MNITRRRSGTAIAATLVLALLGLTGAPARAGTLFAPRSQKVNALGGRVIWAQRNEAGTEWRLMSRANGVTAPLAIAPFPVRSNDQYYGFYNALSGPPAADLGVGPGGRLVATYWRCTRVNVDTLPDGCDIYLYDFERASERKLPASTGSANEYTPTASGNRVAFIRGSHGDRRQPHIYWARLNSHRRHRLPAANPCTGQLDLDRQPCGLGPLALDLSGDLLASAWCCGDDLATVTQIRMVGLSWPSDASVVSGSYDGRANSGEIVSSPSFYGTTLIYGSFGDHDTPNFPRPSARQIDLMSGRVAGAPLSAPSSDFGLDSVARAGERTLYAPYFGPVYDAGAVLPRSVSRLDKPPPASVTGGGQRVANAQLASYCWRGKCEKVSNRSRPPSLAATPQSALVLDLGATATAITVRSLQRGSKAGRPDLYPAPPSLPGNADRVNAGSDWSFSAPARLKRTVTVRISVRYPEGRATFLIRLRPER